MYYLVIDGMMSGTGIRDKYEGEYLEPDSLNLSEDLIGKLKEWHERYIDEHYAGYESPEKVKELDSQGIHIAQEVKRELEGSKIEYFSDATMTSTLI